MHTEQIFPQQWMAVPRKTREKIVADFGIKKSGITEIFNGDVVTDGRTKDDLAVLTSKSMSEYVGSEASFGRLWELTIAKAYSELNAPVGFIASHAQVEELNAVTEVEKTALLDESEVKPLIETLETPEDKAERIVLTKQANIQKARNTRMANVYAREAAKAKKA